MCKFTICIKDKLPDLLLTIYRDQLKKDGNLRDDVYIQDTSDQPKSWEDLKKKVRNALHPDMDKKNERNSTNSLIEDSKPDK